MSALMQRFVVLTVLVAGWSLNAVGSTALVEENFLTGSANWKDNAFLDLGYVASGGSDGGGYVTSAFSLFGMTSGTIRFRGQDEFGSSGGAFVGNWLADGVRVLRAYVRHNAPEPIDFFARIATPNNFPGVAIELAQPVAPGAWTLVEFPTSIANPLLTVEGPPSFYNATLSNVGHVQIGVSPPASLTSDPGQYSFDLDQVSIAVPEPAAWLVGSSIALVLVAGWRRRSH